MKKNKRQILLASLMALVAGGALAVSENASVVTLGTTGPDTYADGTTALDGERYALVWTRTGATFAGFTLTGEIVDPQASALLYAGALAHGGHCPRTAFVIDAEVLAALKGSGRLALYLLDTRSFSGANGAATLGESVQGAKEVVESASLSFADAIGAPATAGSFAPSVAEGVPAPEIVGVRTEGETLVLTVRNTVRAINYTVAGGASPAALSSESKSGAEVRAGNESGDIELRVPMTGASRFFRVTRN